MLLQEDVTYNAKGQPEFDTTWNYKIPSAACIPREIIIRMLEVGALMLFMIVQRSNVMLMHAPVEKTVMVPGSCMNLQETVVSLAV